MDSRLRYIIKRQQKSSWSGYTCDIEWDGLTLVRHFGAASENGSASDYTRLLRLRLRSSNQQPVFMGTTITKEPSQCVNSTKWH